VTPWAAALAAAERRGYEYAWAEVCRQAPAGEGPAANVGELVAAIVRRLQAEHAVELAGGRRAERDRVTTELRRPSAVTAAGPAPVWHVVSQPGTSALAGKLVGLVGAAAAGKSAWCRANYGPGEVLSRDGMRAAVSGDECDLSATADADGVLFELAAARLRRGLTVVVDATGTDLGFRAALARLAASAGAPTELVVFEVPLDTCLRRNAARPGPRPGQRWGRQVPEDRVRAQHAEVEAVLRTVRGLSAPTDLDWRPDLADWYRVSVVDEDGVLVSLLVDEHGDPAVGQELQLLLGGQPGGGKTWGLGLALHPLHLCGESCRRPGAHG
jgi:predicted kinase